MCCLRPSRREATTDDGCIVLSVGAAGRAWDFISVAAALLLLQPPFRRTLDPKQVDFYFVRQLQCECVMNELLPVLLPGVVAVAFAAGSIGVSGSGGKSGNVRHSRGSNPLEKEPIEVVTWERRVVAIREPVVDELELRRRCEEL